MLTLIKQAGLCFLLTAVTSILYIFLNPIVEHFGLITHAATAAHGWILPLTLPTHMYSIIILVLSLLESDQVPSKKGDWLQLLAVIPCSALFTAIAQFLIVSFTLTIN